MNLKIRLENKDDFAEVENLTREAFWDIYRPGCVEHLIAHKLRNSVSFIPELDFVAECDGRIVGNIMYSRSIVVSKENLTHDVITFGPISVSPAFQKNGIGSALIEHTKSLANFLGYKAIIIFGNPDYYHRFGFKSAESFGITTSDGANFDAFMAIELYDGALQGISGRFFEDAVFDVGDDEVEAFEKNFSFKEKHVTDTQFK